jgi:hypothetical protein
MRAQILAPNTVTDYRPNSPKPFGWRSSQSTRRWKLFGVTTSVVVPAVLTLIIGLV